MVNWIKNAIKNPDSLHKALKVAEGKKIPQEKIDKAAKSKNPSLARKANLAKTLSKMRKK